MTDLVSSLLVSPIMSKDGTTTSAAGGKYFWAIIVNMQIPLTSCCANHTTEDSDVLQRLRK